MPNVKTAISVPDKLFDRINLIAKERGASRSKIISLAIENYLRQCDGQRIVDQIDAVYAEIEPDPEEEAFRRAANYRLASKIEWD